VTGRLTPRWQAASDRLEEILATAPLPVSTPELIAAFNGELTVQDRVDRLKAGELILLPGDALRLLNRLARAGKAERLTRRGQRPVYWRRTPC
jgi:hypothetical protein